MELGWSDLFVPVGVGLFVLAIVARRAFGFVLYGLAPRLARNRVVPNDAPAARPAREKYGKDLSASGFVHLGAYRFTLPIGGSLGVFDVWASHTIGVFATIAPKGSQLILTSYLEPGPAAVMTSDTAGTEYKRAGYHHQHVLGLSVDTLIARHLELSKAFAEGTGGPWQPWRDFSMDGLWTADAESSPRVSAR